MLLKIFFTLIINNNIHELISKICFWILLTKNQMVTKVFKFSFFSNKRVLR